MGDMIYNDYEERIDAKQGTYIVAGSREFETLIERKDLELTPGTVKPDELTTLWDWFNRPCQYLGMIGKRAIFYLGQGDSDLFEQGAYYYDVTHIFLPDRIGKAYNYQSFRDSFWKNGRWK